MPKNIVILLDGTSNEISANRTNVLRLYGTLEKSDSQLVYYDPGVGTFGAENAWLRFWRQAVESWGLATGWGLDQNVKEAYRFLVETYDDGRRGREQPQGRDAIFIFGFSRGAYSALVLAGFLRAFGLIRPRNLNLVDYAYRAYKRIGEAGEGGAGSFDELRLYERLLDPDRPPIRLLGLFDTVASVIEHGRYWPRIRSHAFTRRNTSVETVRHAVALDERRTMFRPQLWPEGGEYRDNPFNQAGARSQDAREVWFTGVHGDVGGGYPEAESGLAKLPLQWMIEQAGPTGLRFNAETVDRIVLGDDPKYLAPDPFAQRHELMNRAWAILEFVPRRSRGGPGAFGFSLPYFRPRKVPDGARVHRSAIDRAQTTGETFPNLPPNHRIED